MVATETGVINVLIKPYMFKLVAGDGLVEFVAELSNGSVIERPQWLK